MPAFIVSTVPISWMSFEFTRSRVTVCGWLLRYYIAYSIEGFFPSDVCRMLIGFLPYQIELTNFVVRIYLFIYFVEHSHEQPMRLHTVVIIYR